MRFVKTKTLPDEVNKILENINVENFKKFDDLIDDFIIVDDEDVDGVTGEEKSEILQEITDLYITSDSAEELFKHNNYGLVVYIKKLERGADELDDVNKYFVESSWKADMFVKAFTNTEDALKTYIQLVLALLTKPLLEFVEVVSKELSDADIVLKQLNGSKDIEIEKIVHNDILDVASVSFTIKEESEILYRALIEVMVSLRKADSVFIVKGIEYTYDEDYQKKEVCFFDVDITLYAGDTDLLESIEKLKKLVNSEMIEAVSCAVSTIEKQVYTRVQLDFVEIQSLHEAYKFEEEIYRFVRKGFLDLVKIVKQQITPDTPN